MIAQPENAATEALAFVLARSRSARAALEAVLRDCQPLLPEGLAFVAQQSLEDGGRPDLHGVDDRGRSVAFVEAKFWAGLTDRQPSAYVAHLADVRGGVVLFVAPALRIPTLWDELCSRVPGGVAADVRSVDHACRLPAGVVLAVTSWQQLLQAIAHDVRVAGEADAAADLEQLLGFCVSMDTDAFLPLRSEELAETVGRRAEDFKRLAADLYWWVVGPECPWAEKDGNASTQHDWYGGGVRIHGWKCWIRFSPSTWARFGRSPLWLRVQDEHRDVPSAAVRAAMAELERSVPPRVYWSELDCGRAHVPLVLPTGAERDAVLEHLKAQVREVAALIERRTRP
jgi:hypothetical protein